MALSKGVKNVLFVLVGIYVVGIALFLYKVYTAEESPAKEKAVERLMKLSEELHKEDPKAKELSDKEAEAVFDDAILERGSVIGFNYTLFMQVLNFAILLVAMYGLLWGPLVKFLDERRDTIRSDIESAKSQREEAENTLGDAKAQLRETREERRGIIDAAQKEAEGEREERQQAARKEAEGMIERAKKEIEAHVAAGKTELRNELRRLSVQLAEKIIEREIREEDHAELVNQFIAEIESKAKEGSN